MSKDSPIRPAAIPYGPLAPRWARHGPNAVDAVERGRAGAHRGVMGGVVRCKARADRFATVDRTLTEQAYVGGRV